MYFSGSICFKVTDTASFDDDITNQIGFQPTEIVKKGTQVTQQRIAPCNIWFYTVKFEDTNFNEQLYGLTCFLLEYKGNIRALVSRYERVEIDIYLHTLYGQFGFSLPSVVVDNISRLGININFHLLSYGGVAD